MNNYLLLLGMYFLPDLKFRLLVEVVIKSLLSESGEEEEGAIMDWDIMLLEEFTVPDIPVIISPVMDWLMLGGRSPTPAILELSPGNTKICLEIVSIKIWLNISFLTDFLPPPVVHDIMKQCNMSKYKAVKTSSTSYKCSHVNIIN